MLHIIFCENIDKQIYMLPIQKLQKEFLTNMKRKQTKVCVRFHLLWQIFAVARKSKQVVLANFYNYQYWFGRVLINIDIGIRKMNL